ncbi:MAG: phage tail protein [Cyanobacteria bacterium P01_D01_bin.156]
MRDVNNGRYHLVFGEDDWDTLSHQEGQPRKWEYDSQRQGIRLQAEIFQFDQLGASPNTLSPDQRRDSDRDSYGHWYWIDPTGTQIQVRWANASGAEILFPSSPADCPTGPTQDFQPVTVPAEAPDEPLVGLAIVAEGYLVVGSPTTASLLVFDLYALDGGYIRLPLPAIDSQPIDLAALADGGLLVLDQNRRVWRYDRYLRPEESSNPAELTLFQPKTGQPRRQVAPATGTATLLSETTNPIALSVLPNGSFWVLDQPAVGASVLWHYGANGVQSVELVTANLVDTDADDLDLGQIRAYDLAYLPDAQGATGTLFVVDVSGNQAYGLRVVSLEPLVLRVERRYYPMRSFDGVTLVPGWADGEVYYHQSGDRWLPIKALPRQKYETQGSLVLSPTLGQAFLDGREPNCLWHRLCVDACLPPDTQLQVECRAADNIDHLGLESWQLQPSPYQRPSTEIPYSSMWSEAELTKPDTGTWELLFQDIQGRYLELRLTLVGNGRSTPLVRSLRVHYPRFSYLREYLPKVYQQDPVSVSFLDRFLANPEGVFTTVEGLIAQVQTLFDVRTVPTDAVDWLASWIGLALDPGWSDYQRRLLIAQAPYFFQRRGTQIGLLQAILLTIYPEFGPQIFQDNVAELCPTVRIVERFLTRTQPGIVAGDPTDPELTLTGDIINDAKARAHRFTVMVPTTLSANTQQLVERIVTLEKPAHTAFTLKQYWALFRVGEVRLGLDTVLGQGGQFDTFRLGQFALAEASLGTAFPYSLTNRTVIAH